MTIAISDALPAPFDPPHATHTFERLAAMGYAFDGEEKRLLTAVFANSPYLCRAALREPAALTALFSQGPESVLDGACRKALDVGETADLQTAMTALRRAKTQTALTVAVCDIAGHCTLEQVTTALARFADAALKGALRFALKEAAAGTELESWQGADIESRCGLTILGMGKYGAFELNYSSDIDIVAFFDDDTFPFRKFDEPRPAAVEIVKRVVKLIGEITADGYVFRVDLRLRPDASSTQIAISLDAAAEYYEEMGQNWERAAMIKARPVAGDPKTGEAFLTMIRPFIWRRHLDFAAIEDIQSIKRQIHAQYGGTKIAVAGHNIKLGRGGIREIEFFVQTQQLILGGRDASLRPAGTLAAMQALVRNGTVKPETATELTGAYRFLRTLEHRLQMIEDLQTHSIGKSEEAVTHIASFMGFADAAAFSEAVLVVLRTVQGHYAKLFENDGGESDLSPTGSLVFTGVDHDPDTLKTLTAMGFKDPVHVSGAIMKWHRGSTRATHGARARERLTKLTPTLLVALSRTVDPDVAFAQFDRFLTGLPAGVQLFSLLQAHEELLRLISELMGSAPRLAEHLSRAPATLDALLDPDFFAPLPGQEALTAQLRRRLASAGSYENVLDETRRFVKEQIFRVGVQVIEGLAKAEVAGLAFADIAESAVATLLPTVEAELAASAGRIPGGAFAVIAMGKLGGREMTAGSDLDLVFVYDVPEGVEESDGPKPLPVIVYYARLSQRLIAALTVLTSAGGLYEVDMRLRPTGNKGPAAVSLGAFRRYHETEAWTWERMAMTRARIIAGPPALAATLSATIRETLCRRQDWATLSGDARNMRAKVAAQYPGKNPWDIKYAPGGLMDIEFAVQTLQLRHAPDHPQGLSTNTVDSLSRLAAIGAIATDDAATLSAAAGLESALMQVLRMALEGALDPQTATPGLKALLARAAGTDDFSALHRRLIELQRNAHEIFCRVLAE